MNISLNGVICEEKEAFVSVYDHGFLYGMGLFETFRTYGGRPFLLEDHLTRLQEGCSELGIVYETDLVKLQQHIGELLLANGLRDAYIRLSVSAGVAKLGLPDGDYQQPNVIIYVKELSPRPVALAEQGIALQRLQLRRNSPESATRMKSFHYMNNILAKKELLKYPWAKGAEGILLNDQGFVTEGITSNVFFIKANVCFTPAIQTGILPGITRSFIGGLVKQSEMELQEGHYHWQELVQADEIFITNSIQEIVPICKLFVESGESWDIGRGRTGPVTRRLMEQYRQVTQALG